MNSTRQKSYLHDDKVTTQVNYKILFKKLWPYLLKEKWVLIWVMSTVLISAAISRLLPTLIGLTIDQGIVKKDMDTVVFYAAIYLFLQVTWIYFMFAEQYYFQKLGNRILYQMREDIIKHVQNLTMSFIDRTPSGRIVTRITNDIHTLGQLFTDGVIQILTNAIVLISILIAMSIISLKLTLISLCFAPAFFYIVFYLTKKLKIILRESKRIMAHINSFVAENIKGMKVVQLNNRVGKNQSYFKKLSSNYRHLQVNAVYMYAYLWPTVNLFIASTIALSLYWGGILNSEGVLPIGMLVAFFMHIQDINHPLRHILERYQMFQNSITSAERVFSLLDEDIEDNHNPPPSESFLLRKNQTQKPSCLIEFKNVSFRYSPDLPWALNDVSFKIQPNEKVAIVGRTGSGKSTIISLLQKMYFCSKGEIFINHIPIKEIPLNELRQFLGVVQQDNYVFRGTLKENIRLKNNNINNNNIDHALELLKDHPFFKSKQLEFIEENGVNLSTGERQLIALARIIAYNPKVLIFDEATANIDSESESFIQQALKTLTIHRTSIIIAHRLSTIMHCDRIFVLDQGTLVESGSHYDLLSHKSHYFNLYSTQTKQLSFKTN